ncbi:nuclease-related domain-containing protein [Ureibacillus manganicus]|uniref:NERD domain-containing protein n=1 Tax=Ureibacillus manganicus DSM 26584 TaxID=1384049 RepID=A0A0A3I602_9BACL|nr:nuclease-related domain-containing protein [Ureibacillus manganicus]KGR80221.1 hypothetical protein CD29_02370 [Ureibacillus manganicus DSM 26584]
MIVLKRVKSNRLQVLEALLRRLPVEDCDYPKFQKSFFQLRKGYLGELRSDREWNEIRMPDDHYLLFNYETVNEVGNINQIDTLMLSRYFLFIMEVKNITGKIDFDDEKRQFTNFKGDNNIEVYTNPEDQIERHMRMIYKIMKMLNIHLPILGAIVFSNTSTIIGEPPKRIPAFHLSGLNSHVNSLFHKYSKQVITLNELNLLKDYLLEILERDNWKPNIDKSKLKKGAICENCNDHSPMKYYYGRFICQKCKSMSKDILLESLLDYRVLFNPWISNNEFKQFFSISSVKTSYKLLKSLNLDSKGNDRSRIYYIPNNIKIK